MMNSIYKNIDAYVSIIPFVITPHISEDYISTIDQNIYLVIIYLRSFYKKIQPGGPGWAKVIKEAKAESIQLVDGDEGWSVPSGIIAMLLGCLMIYSTMFATGYYIYGDYQLAFPLTGLAVVSAYFLVKIWKKVKATVLQPKITPAIVADIKETKEPAIIALKPSSVNILRVFGAIIPMPPTCIPMDAKLANPQSIQVAITTDF